jgi:Putative adhesin
MKLDPRPAAAFPRSVAWSSARVGAGRARRGSMIAAALAVALAATGCVDIVGADLGRYTERDEKHFAVSGTPDVTLGTFDGSIEVRPWDKPEVQVVVEKRGKSKAAIDTIDIRTEHDGNRVTVEARVGDNHGFNLRFNDSRSARLIVSLPAASNVVAKSGDGAIDIERVDGHIQLRSGDGSIRARDVNGDLNVHTGDGSITLGGRLTSVRAHSGDGSVRVQAAEGSSPNEDWDITTGDGSVTLEIPDSFGAELDAHTGDGGISTRDVTVSNVTGRIGRNSLRGRLGNGGHTLRVRTGDGSITLVRARTTRPQTAEREP